MASNSNSLANIVTHFEGNKRKYIIWVAAGLGVASIAGCIWYYVQESYYYYTPVEVRHWCGFVWHSIVACHHSTSTGLA